MDITNVYVSEKSIPNGIYSFVPILKLKNSISKPICVSDLVPTNELYNNFTFTFGTFNSIEKLPDGCISRTKINTPNNIQDALLQPHTTTITGDITVVHKLLVKFKTDDEIRGFNKISHVYKMEVFKNVSNILAVYKNDTWAGMKIIIYNDFTVHFLTYGSGMFYINCLYGRMKKIQ
jgi:hypothetical protein